MSQILLVDDDQNILTFVSRQLEKNGDDVVTATDGRRALEKLKTHDIDIAIVDIMMPFMDGLSLTEVIKKNHDIPVIMLTAKSQIDDKREAFTRGADDYLTKPFEFEELLFRIEAILRRTNKSDKDFIRLKNIVLDKTDYIVKIDNKTLKLPLKEFELLYYFADHTNQVFSREQLIEEIWGFDFEGDNRTVDVHVKRLRSRFKDNDTFEIRTIRNVGYSLEITQDE
ncbi:response regulator transcription factor [Aliicoccus persicus]|uniref:Heme response regulator HssR n=1 Tax=Aliicoccus persicus TaxID=930138 RepID=A0A662Z253_9STAP|nr:response regulator transcription factor [Aliicoccus persicus]SEV93047.1 DNA-binding response regulator, OmpR family, contains REC and winged-helix (wHTH) domain [Aliicoccus persicus]